VKLQNLRPWLKTHRAERIIDSFKDLIDPTSVASQKMAAATCTCNQPITLDGPGRAHCFKQSRFQSSSSNYGYYQKKALRWESSLYAVPFCWLCSRVSCELSDRETHEHTCEGADICEGISEDDGE